MSFNFALSTFILFFVFFFINPDSLYSQVIVEEDERIIVFVESLARADSYPESLTVSGLLYSIPLKGNDLVLIYLNIVEKRDLRIDKADKKYTDMHLIDNNKDRYEARIHGIVDPDSPTRRREYVYFQMPKVATPVLLEINYPYREAEAPKSRTGLLKKDKIRTGQLNIDLTTLQQLYSK